MKQNRVAEAKTCAMLKAFLDHSEHGADLPRFLSSELKATLEEAKPGHAFNPKLLFSSTSWSEPIHFSWFAEVISRFPPFLQPFFINVLPQHQAQGVSTTLSSPVDAEKTSPFLKPYLADILRSELIEPELITEQLLPPSTLNILINLERNHLIRLCDLLGMHDLAADLRQVVDKQLLAKIYAALSPQKVEFLQYCSKQPMKWVPPKLGLAAWDRSPKQLNNLLHYRGLLRLARAISEEVADFKWHLLHRFDIGRARIIQKELYKKQNPALVPYFKNQVLYLAERAHVQQDRHVI